ncbi:hypothetical protein AJ85_06255 [Alkalihalobacillus alcalophilus ATCC 27647 = CGMCC 1.3604]|uniref:Uncharacterized protein n=1 Tax=Alkalihalobacillus alcalophilus ATCC 27647 = CGMCC 1.3604 TaxID=1218173 RepID=A0A4S4K0R5_ALKAL|nr:hypothetical protein [Alkalihalobacillus alcalophilus]MED1560808.1 hypothetical protein [Alkalihalobacillus alcalophilus]THG91195.1 hypothetical protein AJ85_06255 [Alkalihalobacillus alcalophilus ATCC 27647 = CGMCC 1.3604]
MKQELKLFLITATLITFGFLSTQFGTELALSLSEHLPTLPPVN